MSAKAVKGEVMPVITRKPRRKRRAKPNPLAYVAREARRQKREMNKYLSEQLSHVLGFKVEVRVKMDPAMSPESKRAIKGSRDYKRLLASFANSIGSKQ